MVCWGLVDLNTLVAEKSMKNNNEVSGRRIGRNESKWHYDYMKRQSTSFISTKPEQSTIYQWADINIDYDWIIILSLENIVNNRNFIGQS